MIERLAGMLFTLLLLLISASAQTLYVPANATINVYDGAELYSGGTIQNDGKIQGFGQGGLGTGRNLENDNIVNFFSGEMTIAGDLNNRSSFGIGQDSELTIGQDMTNNGVFNSAGDIYLAGNWTNNSTMNLIDANLIFNGSGDQQMDNSNLIIKGIGMQSGGTATINSDDVAVSGSLDFQSGILQPGTSTRVILEEDAETTGGYVNSYYNGPLIYKGTGFRYFPVGNNGHFGPVELDRVVGSSSDVPVLAVSHIWTNPVDPIPNKDLIGVSSNGLWKVELLSGTFDSSQVYLDFDDEDLENFVVENQINASHFSPVIAYADSMGGIFHSLGVSSLEDTDSLTYGRILSDSSLIFSDTSNIRYLALAKAPLVPADGVFYIPEAFSPNASNPVNQTFRVFGERISPEGFLMQVYNRKKIKVYETTSLEEARQIGWDGTNQNNGYPEPSGVYYYKIIYKQVPLNTDPIEVKPTERIDEIYLIR